MQNHKIAIYGGTFDPVHKAHQHVIDEVLAHSEYNKIICVPTAQNPLKKKHSIASNEDRLNMLELLYRDSKTVSVSDFELKKGGISYTADTVEHYIKKFDLNTKIGLIMGSDVSLQISQWAHLEKLQQYVKLLIIPRPHYEIAKEKDRLAMFEYSILDNVVPLDIEAHILRTSPANMQEAVDKRIWKYITDKRLYNIC